MNNYNVNYRARTFTGVWNNVEDALRALEAFIIQGKATWCLGQYEKGEETGTPHLQFVVNWKNPTTIKSLHGKYTKVSWKVADYPPGAITYCTKEKTRIDGPWEYGIRPAFTLKEKGDKNGDRYRAALDCVKQGNLYQVEADLLIKHYGNLKKLAVDFGQPYASKSTRGIWIYGGAGSGKTTWARSLFPEHGEPFVKTKDHWWDGYMGLKVVLMDDLDNITADLDLKLWAHEHPVKGATKGGFSYTLHDYFIVTSNFSIDELFIKEPVVTLAAVRRRFEVVKVMVG